MAGIFEDREDRVAVVLLNRPSLLLYQGVGRPTEGVEAGLVRFTLLRHAFPKEEHESCSRRLLERLPGA